jgi:hypothetical protein
MKRLVLLALLALALPLTAFANEVDFTNNKGTLKGTDMGLSLTGSILRSVDGLGKGNVGNLGTVSFTTGALMQGTLAGGGMFAGGGNFTITRNAAGLADELPANNANGVIFVGSFSGPVTWTKEGNGIYQLSGHLSGTWSNGVKITDVAFTSQLYFGTISNQEKKFSSEFGSGDTLIPTTTPEPGTLGLLGTGLAGLAGLVRKKLSG